MLQTSAKNNKKISGGTSAAFDFISMIWLIFVVNMICAGH
jgi:hypothetical protein